MPEETAYEGVVDWASGISMSIRLDGDSFLSRFDINDVYVGAQAAGTRGRRVRITCVADEGGERITKVECL